MYKNLLLTTMLAVFAFISLGKAQDCETNEVSVILELRTDYYAYETSWAILDLSGDILFSNPPLADTTYYEFKFCFNPLDCSQFVIRDSYGDGFTSNGFSRLIVDGEEEGYYDNYGFAASKYFNCPPGFDCDDAFHIDDFNFTASLSDNWYILNVDEVGQYEISTCDNPAECNTTIYVYLGCPIDITNSVEGTSFYNDYNDQCGELASVVSNLNKDLDYIVRITRQGDCGPETNISVKYLGPIEGCTDPESCNYNPLATVDDGSCISFDDPECPEGPDLRLNPFTLSSSMYVTVFDNTDECLISEGCIKGVGRRDIVRFSTRIENIGTQDYFIGDPEEQPGQFTFDNCHNHYHYDGYAQYSLYDTYGQYIPIGYKNGFCVLDLECPQPMMAKYSCNYMGITAGCADIYDAGLDCQWLDITDIPDGDYVFVAVVNVDLARDALGRSEKDTLNNYAQVCINLDRSSGSPVITKDDSCEPYTDCNGDIYGNALRDCQGICDGTRMRGDRNLDQVYDASDINAYLEGILKNEDSNECIDLFDDDVIDVYDVALLHDCIQFGLEHEHESGSAAHDHCYFPGGVYNFLDTMTFSLKYDKDNDPEFVYVDILNPQDRLMAFELNLQGARIEEVYEHTDFVDQLFDIRFDESEGTIIGIPYENSFLERSNFEQGLLKIRVTPMDTLICLKEEPVLVATNLQKVAVKTEQECHSTLYSSIEQIVNDVSMEVYPNPSSSILNVNINNDSFRTENISCYSADGKLVFSEDTKSKNATINVKDWQEGMYFVIVTGKDKQFIKKFIVNDTK